VPEASAQPGCYVYAGSFAWGISICEIFAGRKSITSS